MAWHVTGLFRKVVAEVVLVAPPPATPPPTVLSQLKANAEQGASQGLLKLQAATVDVRRHLSSFCVGEQLKAAQGVVEKFAAQLHEERVLRALLALVLGYVVVYVLVLRGAKGKKGWSLRFSLTPQPAKADEDTPTTAGETAEGAEKSVLKVLEECLAGLRGNVTAEGQGSLDALEGLPKRLEMASGTQDALQRLSQTAADEANTALVKEVEALKAQVLRMGVEKKTVAEHMERVKAIHSDQIKAMASRQLQLQSKIRDSKRAKDASTAATAASVTAAAGAAPAAVAPSPAKVGDIVMRFGDKSATTPDTTEKAKGGSKSPEVAFSLLSWLTPAKKPASAAPQPAGLLQSFEEVAEAAGGIPAKAPKEPKETDTPPLEADKPKPTPTPSRRPAGSPPKESKVSPPRVAQTKEAAPDMFSQMASMLITPNKKAAPT